ncbi:MAG: LysM peptidoglycan-binding domain-containing protein [Clostridiales bacterium]|nr:LysM peptidoglycan-binding domain-containing protein [Clostridiales bacterium]
MSRLSGNMIKYQTCYESNKRRIWIAGTAVLLLVLLFSVVFISKTVTAQRIGSRQKLITSVEVKQGDTLWSIASAYISDEYDSIHEYIKEIKTSNGLASDEIHAGNYIIVPYYADTSY